MLQIAATATAYGHALCRRHGYGRLSHTLRLSTHTHKTYKPHSSQLPLPQKHHNYRPPPQKPAGSLVQNCCCAGAAVQHIPSLPPAVPSGVKVKLKLLSWRDKGQQTALQQAAATAAAMLVRTQCVCRRHFKPQDKNTPQATNRHTSECAGMRQKPCSSQEDMVSQPTECCTQLSRVATKPALWPQQNRQSHWQQQDVPPVPALD